MAQMTRKQIYVQRQQLAPLKKLAKLRGVSEAEVIRRALDRELAGSQSTSFIDVKSWDQAYQFMQTLREKGPIPERARVWKREDLYEERLRPHGKHSH